MIRAVTHCQRKADAPEEKSEDAARKNARVNVCEAGWGHLAVAERGRRDKDGEVNEWPDGSHDLTRKR